ncbi:Zinc finger CCCH domain-containing protein 18 [Quillaja saponaria]|uniref:Zinc finger CCCH domain-containing protein 18 n=1 Tax=Quillaja saponaria TaxID=32244 RepID=A0AAD7PM59_QUISA|nr:Zinc finger CCCH domain-containing protein 18 [Quillaja saponaria]
MDISESTRILFDKIQKLEPENVTKIIGYLLLRDHGDEDIVQLAMAPDHLLHEVVFKAKTELQRLPNKSAMAPISPPMNPPHVLTHLPAVSPRTFRSPGSFLVPSAYWDPQLASNINSDFIAPGYMDSILELQNQSQSQLYGLKNQLEPVKMGISGLPHDYYYLDNASGNLNGRGHHRFSSLPEFPVKTCHYFSRGFCKHGSSCRYYHDQVQPESFSQMYDDDQVFSPGSLAQLELELIELLKPRRGNPLSIASLPLVYYDKYKKVLQADGYLTESQRHGKTGYSLTKLLARLKNSICIIDRPHGQHAVILAEDAPKYMEYRSVKNDPGSNC